MFAGSGLFIRGLLSVFNVLRRSAPKVLGQALNPIFGRRPQIWVVGHYPKSLGVPRTFGVDLRTFLNNLPRNWVPWPPPSLMVHSFRTTITMKLLFIPNPPSPPVYLPAQNLNAIQSLQPSKMVARSSLRLSSVSKTGLVPAEPFTVQSSFLQAGTIIYCSGTQHLWPQRRRCLL